jgi:alanine racemase
VTSARPADQAGGRLGDAGETAILTIDLDALAANYRKLRDLAGQAECAAVVKADAYGLGVAEAAPALWRAGCRTFFVATPNEGVELRALLPEATIYVFAGLLPGAPEIYREHTLRPVLNSAADVAEWARICSAAGEPLPCGVHIDSGMNRLGLGAAEVEAVAAERDLWAALTLSLVMSHLACADDPAHPKSEAQRSAFDRLRARLPAAPASLANSAGILLGSAYLYDLVRPGLALYGGHPRRAGANPFLPVVHLLGRVLQIRDVNPGETVGYGATRTLGEPARIATVAVGYADGFFRALSVSDGAEGLVVSIEGHAAPVLGRVSMDLITVDVSAVPEGLARAGGFVELIGPKVTAQEVASRAGTIDYEVLTSLGRRAARRYIGG